MIIKKKKNGKITCHRSSYSNCYVLTGDVTLIESLGLFSGTKLYVPVLPQIVVLVIDNLPM